MLCPSDTEVTDDTTVANVLSHINHLVNRRVKKRSTPTFPVPTPISVTPERLAAAETVPHAVFPKTDGYHYLMLCTSAIDGTPRTYFVARNLRVFEVPVAAPRSVFKDTLFEGELVARRPDDTIEFLIFRILWYAGTSMMGKPLLDRVAAVKPLVSSKDGATLSSPALFAELRAGKLVSRQANLVFAVKRAYPAVAMMEVFNAEVEKWGSHACDGIVLVPNVSHRDMLSKYPELKAKFCHTLDFVLRLRAVTIKGKAKRTVNIMYTLGAKLQNAHTLLLLGCDHVAIKLENNDAFTQWRAAAASLPIGGVQEQVVEFRCVLTPLSRGAAARWNQHDLDRVQRLRNERWQDGTRNNEQLLIKARKFKYVLSATFVKPRPDKEYPNTLPTIVSTLTQSVNLPMQKVADELKAFALRAKLRCERDAGLVSMGIL